MAGAPISPLRAASRLGYNLDQAHTAAVVWSELPETESGHLDQASEALAQLAGASRPLGVIASAATRRVWMPTEVLPDVGRLGKVIEDLRGVRIAIGKPARGVDGFRRSHLDAFATQRLLARLHSTQRVASFDAVQLVSLVTESRERLDQFISETLGELESANAEIRTPCVCSSTNNEMPHARRRGCTLTEIRCCVGFPAQMSYCRGRSKRTASTSRSRSTCCTGAAPSDPGELANHRASRPSTRALPTLAVPTMQDCSEHG